MSELHSMHDVHRIFSTMYREKWLYSNKDSILEWKMKFHLDMRGVWASFIQRIKIV